MDVNLQHLVVFLLVTACCIYALWTLMPAIARRFIAKKMVKWPLGSTWKAWLQQAASESSGCGCSGCDKVVDQTRKQQPQVVHFQARPKD